MQMSLWGVSDICWWLGGCKVGMAVQLYVSSCKEDVVIVELIAIELVVLVEEVVVIVV